MVRSKQVFLSYSYRKYIIPSFPGIRKHLLLISWKKTEEMFHLCHVRSDTRMLLPVSKGLIKVYEYIIDTMNDRFNNDIEFNTTSILTFIF